MRNTQDSAQTVDIHKIFDYIQQDDLSSLQTLVAHHQLSFEYSFQWETDPIILKAMASAISLGKLEIIDYFLGQGVSPNRWVQIQGQNKYARFISHAIHANQLEAVKLLVSKGALIYEESQSGCSNFHAISDAVRENATEIAIYLLTQGASPHAVVEVGSDHDFCCLEVAAKNKNTRLVRRLVENGANLHKVILFLLKELASKSSRLNEDYREERKIHLEQELQNANKYIKSHCQSNLEEFEKEKKWLLTNIHDLEKTLELLFDYSAGLDLPVSWELCYGAIKLYDCLDCLKSCSISFIGVSIDGVPVTPNLLSMRGIIIRNGIFRLNDLHKLNDQGRKDAIQAWVEFQFERQGRIELGNGIFNMIPLWKAAEKGDAEIVTFRLLAPVNPNTKGGYARYSMTAPIIYAARHGHFDVVRLLAEHPKFNKETLIAARSIALENDHHEIGNYLGLADPDAVIDRQGNTQLHIATKKGDKQKVLQLLQHGANPIIQNSKHRTAIDIAMENSHCSWEDDPSVKENASKIIKLLLAHLPSKRDRFRWLELAVKYGNINIAKFILKKTEEKPSVVYKARHKTGKTSKIELPWYGNAIFMALDADNPIEMLQILKTYGADFNFIHPETQQTLLMLSTKKILSSRVWDEFQHDVSFFDWHDSSRYTQSERRAILLKEKGAYINREEKRYNRGLAIIEYLVQNGANPSSVINENNETLLHIAAKKGNFDLAILLLKKYADIESKDAHGNTPLHIAVKQKNFKLIRLFMSESNITSQNNQGETPNDLVDDRDPTLKNHLAMETVWGCLWNPEQKDQEQSYIEWLPHEVINDVGELVNPQENKPLRCVSFPGQQTGFF